MITYTVNKTGSFLSKLSKDNRKRYFDIARKEESGHPDLTFQRGIYAHHPPQCYLPGTLFAPKAVRKHPQKIHIFVIW
jgi:hypothetical protein